MLCGCDSVVVVGVCVFVSVFFFKQKTAYEMRISDWSSDVCSSDLPGKRHFTAERRIERGEQLAALLAQFLGDFDPRDLLRQPRLALLAHPGVLPIHYTLLQNGVLPIYYTAAGKDSVIGARRLTTRHRRRHLLGMTPPSSPPLKPDPHPSKHRRPVCTVLAPGGGTH